MRLDRILRRVLCGLLFSALWGCGSSAVPPSAVPGIVAGAPSSTDLYIDVDSKAQLGGIPYYVEGAYKVSVSTFAEIQWVPPVVDKRVAFTGVKSYFLGYDDGFIGIDRAFSGDTEFRVTMGVKSNPGTESGYGGGYILMNYPPIKKFGDSQAHTYLGAWYDTVSSGFLVQAWDANMPVGFPTSIPNTNQVDLRMTRVGGSVVLSARPTPAWPDVEGGWVDVFTVFDPLPKEACSLEFGAEGLDPGGQVFFDFFYVGGPTVGGTAETSPMEHMGAAIDKCDEARPLLEMPAPDFPGASAILVNALADIAAAKADIDAGIEKDSFQANTRDALARKASERARKSVEKVKKFCDDGNAAKQKVILKTLEQGRGHCVVTIANLAGVKTTTSKKLPALK